MDTPKYLYHYTSLETLALILEKRKLCFNNLCNVDDIEESETADVKSIGMCVLVSCWTDEEKEMIPMWSLYTPKMKGVRIRLPVFPFKKNSYRAGEYGCSEDTESFVDLKTVYEENKGDFRGEWPLLIQVKYEDDESKLFPKVRTNGSETDVQKFLKGDFTQPTHFGYSLKELGHYKRTDWQFQKEWRYLINFVPIGVKDQENVTHDIGVATLNRIEKPNGRPIYEKFFLDLAEDAISQMEVLLGPCMSDAEKILAKALLYKYGLDNSWKESSLKIR